MRIDVFLRSSSLIDKTLCSTRVAGLNPASTTLTCKQVLIIIIHVEQFILPVCEDRQFFGKPISVAGTQARRILSIGEFDSLIGYYVVFK